MSEQHRKIQGINRPIDEQVNFFLAVIALNKNIKMILESNPFPHNKWYLGAGCLCQTVWNYLSSYPITRNIKDYDLVYFNNNLSKKAELAEQERVRTLLSNPAIQIDVINEARVHLWYEKDLGKKISPYRSVEAAINTWPTTATVVGVRKDNSGIKVYAPYGLNDLLSMTVKPNKPHTIKAVYLEKTKRWKKNWPLLTVSPWKYPE